jgi:phage-related holin
MERINTAQALLKYIFFIFGCTMTYFEPMRGLLVLVLVLFIVDFVTGVLKSRKVYHSWTLKSRKLRWSFVKMLVYMFVMALTFYVCEAMYLEKETVIGIVKIQAWCIIYIEGLSIVENLLAVFSEDKFLKFLHYALSVEFLKYIPILSNFIKEKEGED